ncbi:alpha-2-macroglobulin family protein [Pasteurella multocida]|nr:alpha-2-macroglobulin family protein [Pasteurella multocida]
MLMSNSHVIFIPMIFFTSPLSYGVVPFTVNVDNRRLKITAR